MELIDVKKKTKTGELTWSMFGGKSEVWNHFNRVVGSDNIGRGVGFVIKCSTCCIIQRILNRFCSSNNSDL